MAGNRLNGAEQTLERVETALEAGTPERRARRERAGYLMARQEERLLKATEELHSQVHAEESEYDSTKLFDAAQEVLSELERLIERLKAVEPEEPAEGAA